MLVVEEIFLVPYALQLIIICPWLLILTNMALATYMADHPDRHTCGKCGNMFYKLTKDGKRLPIPKQNKPQAAAKAEAPAAGGKGAAKGKKK